MSGYFGLASGSLTYQEAANTLLAMRFQNNVGDGSITQVELLSDDDRGGGIRIGIYSDNNGSPGQLLMDCGAFTLVTSWNTFVLPTPLAAYTGEYYWLAYILQNSRWIYYGTGAANSKIWRAGQTYGPMPATIAVTGQDNEQYVMRAYVDTTVEPPPPPPPEPWADLVPNFDSIGVTAQMLDFTITGAEMRYRKLGNTFWIPGIRMSFCQDGFWRSVIIGNDTPNGLFSNTDYEVQVTFTDSTNNTYTVTKTVRTLNDNPAIGTNYSYVAPTGADSSDRGSINLPYRTIQYAVGRAAPGSTIMVRQGTNHEEVTVAVSGTIDNYITIMPYNNEQVIIEGDNIRDWGFRVTGDYVRICQGFTIQNTLGTAEDGGGVTFDDCYGGICEENTMIDVAMGGSGVGASGIRLNYAGNTLVQNNVLFRTRLGDSSAICRRHSANGNCIRHNKIHSIDNYWWDGIVCYPEDDSFYEHAEESIHHNDISGVHDDVLQLDGGGINARVWANKITPPFMLGPSLCGVRIGPAFVFRNIIIMDNRCEGAWKMGDETVSSCGDKFVYHNTIYTSGVGQDNVKQTNGDMGRYHFKNNIVLSSRYIYEMGYAPTAGGPNDMDYNNLYTTDGGRFTKWTASVTYPTLAQHQAGTGMDLHSISDPNNKFVAPSIYDFRLVSDSPNIDKGIPLTGFNDENSLWPTIGLAPDLGAFESDGSITQELPIAGFTATPISGPAPLSVTFINTSAGGPAEYTWDFGDGSMPLVTQDATVLHSFTQSSVVKLTASNNTGITEATVVITVSGSPPPETYTITTATVGNGSVSISPSSVNNTYESGTELVITANPAIGWQFAGWSGSITSLVNPLVTVINSNLSLTATFEQIPVTLTIAISGQGSTVPSTGTAAYHYGDIIDVTAIPASSWQFKHWLENSNIISTNAQISVAIGETNRTITAVFEEVVVPPNEYLVSISVVGMGTTSPMGATLYPENSTITVNQQAVSNWVFDHWEVNGNTVLSDSLYLTINENTNIIAYFIQITHVLIMGVVGQGTTVPSVGEHNYVHGAEVDLVGIPSAGWIFVRWEENGTQISVNQTLGIIMDADRSIVAIFEEVIVPPEQHSVSIAIIGSGETIPAADTYLVNDGELLQLEAVPAEGWKFDHWEGNLSGSIPSAEITVLSNLSITAVFSESTTPAPFPVGVALAGALVVGILIVAKKK
jgi:PKD repeat protein